MPRPKQKKQQQQQTGAAGYHWTGSSRDSSDTQAAAAAAAAAEELLANPDGLLEAVVSEEDPLILEQLLKGLRQRLETAGVAQEAVELGKQLHKQMAEGDKQAIGELSSMLEGLRRLKTLQGLAERTQQDSFAQQAQQQQQQVLRLLRDQLCGTAGSTRCHELEEKYKYNKRMMLTWPSNGSLGSVTTEFARAAVLAATHMQLLRALSAAQHSMLSQHTRDAQESSSSPAAAAAVLSEAAGKLAAALPSALDAMGVYCRCQGRIDSTALQSAPAVMQKLWKSPELLLLIACGIFTHHGSKVVRAFLQQQQQQQMLLAGPASEAVAAAANTSAPDNGSSSSASRGVAGQAEGRLLASADMLQSQAGCAAQLAAMLQQSSAVFQQQWAWLGVPAGMQDGCWPPGCIGNSSSSSGNSGGGRSSSQNAADPADAHSDSLEAMAATSFFLSEALQFHPASCLTKHASPLLLMLLCSASATAGLLCPTPAAAADQGAIAGNLVRYCVDVCVSLSNFLPSAPDYMGKGFKLQSEATAAAAAADVDGARAAAEQMQLLQQLVAGQDQPTKPCQPIDRQLVGQLVHLLRQMVHVVAHRKATSDAFANNNCACCNGAGGAGSSGSSSHRTHTAAKSEEEAAALHPAAASNQVSAMQSCVLLLTNLLHPLTSSTQLVASLQQPQHLEQLACVFQTVEAAVRALGHALLTPVREQQDQQQDQQAHTSAQPPGASSPVAMVPFPGDLANGLYTLLKHLLDNVLGFFLGESGDWAVLRDTLAGQQLLRAGLSLQLTLYKFYAEGGLERPDEQSLLAKAAALQVQLMQHLSDDLYAAAETFPILPCGRLRELPVPDPSLVCAVLALVAQQYNRLADLLADADSSLAIPLWQMPEYLEHVKRLADFFAPPSEAAAAAAGAVLCSPATHHSFDSYSDALVHLLTSLESFGMSASRLVVEQGGNSSSSGGGGDGSSSADASGHQPPPPPPLLLPQYWLPLLRHMRHHSTVLALVWRYSDHLNQLVDASGRVWQTVQQQYQTVSHVLTRGPATHQQRLASLQEAEENVQQLCAAAAAPGPKALVRRAHAKIQEMRVVIEEQRAIMDQQYAESKTLLTAVVPTPSTIGYLRGDLLAVAGALNSAMPTSYTCNRLRCLNMMCVSEAFGLVRGKGCVCGGCVGAECRCGGCVAGRAVGLGSGVAAARYCSVSCQEAHFFLHQGVCPAISSLCKGSQSSLS